MNIGYSCRLLTEEMEEVFVIDAHTDAEVEAQLNKALDEIKNGPSDDLQDLEVNVIGKEVKQVPWISKGTNCKMNEYAIVVNGHSLVRFFFVLPMSLVFLLLRREMWQVKCMN